MGGLLVGAPSALASEAAARPTLRPALVPDKPVIGEKFRVTGRVPGALRRSVQLQEIRKGKWRKVASRVTNGVGAYTFNGHSAQGKRTFRVKARATKKMRAWTSTHRVVNPVTEMVTLSATGDRQASQLTAQTNAPRPGRPARLQRLDAGQWSVIEGPQYQSSSGQVSWRLEHLSALPRTYRVVLQDWGSLSQTPSAETLHNPQSGLPLLELNTTDTAPVLDKETYVTGTYRIGDSGSQSMRIKGRGNSTWGRPKKPYRLKLDIKASLLGMPEEKDWVLLANHIDRSYLRNWAAFRFAEQTSLPWTPQSKFVDVTLKGVDLGNYLLSEQVEQSQQRVSLPDDGLLLEIDRRFQENGEEGFFSTHQVPIAYKDPDTLSAQTEADLIQATTDFEAALYGPNFTDPDVGYRAHVENLDSFVDWYLVNELFKNLDSPFYSSVFLTWKPDAGFSMGPVWDFDLSSGNTFSNYCCVSPLGWWLRGDLSVPRPLHSEHWFIRLLEDPAFSQRVSDRWEELRPAATQLITDLDLQAQSLDQSIRFDWFLWQAIPNPPRAVLADTPGGEINQLSTWLLQRAVWLDSQLL